jgi:hypothetical protein
MCFLMIWLGLFIVALLGGVCETINLWFVKSVIVFTRSVRATRHNKDLP